ncbi:MAG: HNH endonuclease [Phycisphaerales bacterium]
MATFRRPFGAKNAKEGQSGGEPGKTCRLQIDHTIPIIQGGTDEEHNLRAVCVWYNKDKANLKVPTSREAISAMGLIRRQPRNVQLEVYEFLAKKFGPRPDEN